MRFSCDAARASVVRRRTEFNHFIEERGFEAFGRHMNREAHSDVANITDSKEIDPNMLMRAFKEASAAMPVRQFQPARSACHVLASYTGN